ncbi:Epl1p [Kluyveromyces lactis]|uniref:Enhancer of polycomb-like protein 1 n=1 Tax=Kluyveromyces lactis (strain ATCC 8585 / CBS 2359 / DSM 70799 / NBRC 1267 / NRRL Y-1140 / WM37) TaxID=284590 RepID=EPL1_KLULA|nr:uncharacterized protein KLLA0_F25146g [Kluyveromyces lactis]Q6CIN8.1 RecName: Full=Enhancer of polycomb-like protein 1 [Kluyveromyces lactis NRRL Y-1140]CAG98909.1 KLLA0F25146p [Kluyveromyces lactis]|eukprot:XP_456201.1 uncharacterized protein KLLA0_F25146g [Kluyveromyces lactis]
MPAPAVDSSRFRHRKISVKQRLRIYKSHEIKDLEQEDVSAISSQHQQRELMEIETGVEKNEEKEEHLYKILQSNQLRENKKDLFIPTPDASKTWDEFDRFYQGEFKCPTSYIQFSAQLEDCCGTLYNMDEEDEIFLADLNKSLADSVEPLTEDEFELIMANFESSIKDRQPFLSMDPESILSFADLKPTMLKNDVGDSGVKKELAKEIGMPEDEPFLTMFDNKRPLGKREKNMETLIELFGEKIHDHWKQRKISRHGCDIFPQLKSERNNDKDDNDPYVCFRRRELRQPRKTRRIDVQNSQKLRLLCQQLEYTKDLALTVAKRERAVLEVLENEKFVFQARAQLKTMKRKLGIDADNEDLYSAKKQKLVSSVRTIKQQQQLLLQKQLQIQQQQQQQLQQQQAAITSDSSVKRAKSSKSSKLHKEDSGLYADEKGSEPKKKGPKTGSNKNKEQSLSSAQEIGAQSPVANVSNVQQQQKQASSQVYVKLPNSKIPDIVLEDVGKLLHSKEKSTRKFVEDRMRKRKQEDGDIFFNLTDDPYNPVFNLSIPDNVSPQDAPFSSVAGSKFEVKTSYYSPNLQNYITGTANDIKVFNKEGEAVENNEYKKLEFFNPFDNEIHTHSREFPIAFRRRRGRFNMEYIDQRKTDHNINDMLLQFIDLDGIQKQELDNDVINVYDSKLDDLSRSYYHWKYDSNYNIYGSKFSDEPAKLNQISNDTQVVRFGTMLGSKAYEQLRDATIKYRQEQINKRKKLNSLQQQQMLQKGQQPINNAPHSQSSSPPSHQDTRKNPGSTPNQSSPPKKHVTPNAAA